MKTEDQEGDPKRFVDWEIKQTNKRLEIASAKIDELKQRIP